MAFTLIELLIVVVIIAILAAIAVPNFLEAQTRAKVIRCIADMRALRTGLEAYMIDNNRPIMDVPDDREVETWPALTTPVAFVTSIFVNLFISKNHVTPGSHDNVHVYGAPHQNHGGQYVYIELQGWRENGLQYWVQSCGPNSNSDLKDIPGWGSHNGEFIQMDQGIGYLDLIYDPTNGTKSHGDILCSNKRVYNR